MCVALLALLDLSGGIQQHFKGVLVALLALVRFIGRYSSAPQTELGVVTSVGKVCGYVLSSASNGYRCPH